MSKVTGQGENVSKLWVRTSINGPAVQKKQVSQYLLIHTYLSVIVIINFQNEPQTKEAVYARQA